MHRFVHVTIPGGVPGGNPAALEAAATSVAQDWIRYTGAAWILWTSRNLPEISGAFRAALPAEAHVLCLTIAIHDIPAGYMPQWVWDWLNRYRDPATGYVNFPPPALPPPPTNTPNLFATPPTSLADALKAIGDLTKRD